MDVQRPTSARIYDFLLGGVHNFAVDRRVAEQILAVFPGAPRAVQANRAFLRRAVRRLADAGVRQFLDVGSGIPTMGHVHEIAQSRARDARVVYVDIDPVAVEHSREILAGNDRAVVIMEDLRATERILDNPLLRRLFDFSQPVAVLAVAVLDLVSDAYHPSDIVARLGAPLASGSHLVVSHPTEDGPAGMAAMRRIYRSWDISMTLRPRAQVRALFGDFVIVEPGVVWAAQWHPQDPSGGWPADASGYYAGVGRKP